MHPLPCILLLVLGMVARASAGEAHARPDRLVARSATQAGHARILVRHEPGTTTLRVAQRFVGSPLFPASEVAIQVSRVGDVEILPTLDEILVSGVEGTSTGSRGRIDRLTRAGPGGPFQVTESLIVPSADFVGLAYAAAVSKLYVLDATSSEILGASFSPGQGLPQAFTVVVSSSDLACTNDLGEYQLTSLFTGELLAFHHRSASHADAYSIRFGASVDVHAREGHMWRRAFFLGRHLCPDLARIEVFGPPGAAVDVLRVDRDGECVATGITDAMGRGSLPVLTPLEWGGVYVCVVPSIGEHSPPFATPVKRWGEPQTLDMGCALAGSIRPRRCGRSWGSGFPASAHVRCPGTHRGTTSFSASLLAGTESDVRKVGGRWLLEAPVSFSTTLTLDGTRTALRLGITGTKVDLPIPQDPGLVGAVGCYQWVVFEGTNARVSEIIGMAVRELPFHPPSDSMISLAGGSAPRHSGTRPSSGDPRRALLRWWLAAGGLRRSP